MAVWLTMTLASLSAPFPSTYATAPPPQWSNFANLAKQAREQLEVGLGEVVKAGEGLIERVEDVIVEAGECRRIPLLDHFNPCCAWTFTCELDRIDMTNNLLSASAVRVVRS